MAPMDRFTPSNAPVKRLKALQFGILDPDFIVSLLFCAGGRGLAQRVCHVCDAGGRLAGSSVDCTHVLGLGVGVSIGASGAQARLV